MNTVDRIITTPFTLLTVARAEHERIATEQARDAEKYRTEEAERERERLGTMLKKRLGLDVQPTSARYEVDGITFYLFAGNLRASRPCDHAGCINSHVSWEISSLSDLGAFLGGWEMSHYHEYERAEGDEPETATAAPVPEPTAAEQLTALITAMIDDAVVNALAANGIGI